MRFSKPPLLEKLRRLLPARLKDSRWRSVTGWRIYQPASRGDFDGVGELDAFECDVNNLRGILDISASSPQANGQHAGQGKEGQSERVRAFKCVDNRLGTRTVCAVCRNVKL
jgi:hypothetical protein